MADCQTPGAIFHFEIGSEVVSVRVDYGRTINLTEFQARFLENAMHDAIEALLAPHFKTDGLRAGEYTATHTGPLTAEQMKSRGDARRLARLGDSPAGLDRDVAFLSQEIRDEDAEEALGPKTDADDLQRRVTLALADWKPGVYCACLGAGMDPRHVDLPCEHADKHRVGLVDSAIRAAEHEAAQGPGEVID